MGAAAPPGGPSALTRHNAEVTIKALSLGAADYIPKPEAGGGVMTSAPFQRDLIEKIQVLGPRGRKPRPPAYARRTLAPAARKLGGAIQRIGNDPRHRHGATRYAEHEWMLAPVWFEALRQQPSRLFSISEPHGSPLPALPALPAPPA